MIIIGNKPYKNIRLDNIIDTFDETITARCNLGLPNYNNGTKRGIQYVNAHVIQNIKKQNLKTYIRSSNTDPTYISECEKAFYNNKDLTYKHQSLGTDYNKVVAKLGSPYRFVAMPRLGMGAILNVIKDGEYDIKFPRNDNTFNNTLFVSNFSLTNETKTIVDHVYNVDKKPGGCHEFDSEIKILKWLHTNNFVDATLCSLKDSTIPVLDCGLILPSVCVTYLILEEHGVCTLENMNDKKDAEKFVNNISKFVSKNKKNIYANLHNYSRKDNKRDVDKFVVLIFR